MRMQLGFTIQVILKIISKISRAFRSSSPTVSLRKKYLSSVDEIADLQHRFHKLLHCVSHFLQAIKVKALLLKRFLLKMNL